MQAVSEYECKVNVLNSLLKTKQHNGAQSSKNASIQLCGNAFKRLLKLSGNLIQPRSKMLEELHIFIWFFKIVNRQRKKLPNDIIILN